MREVKFRAWLPKQGRIYNWNEFYSIRRMIGGKISLSLSQPSGASFTVYDNFTLMQYTGLKDKNGKEIFDGDIVDINGCKNRVVEWDEDWCGFYLSRELNPVGYFLSEEYEIIGNIYENPELLGD